MEGGGGGGGSEWDPGRVGQVYSFGTHEDVEVAAKRLMLHLSSMVHDNALIEAATLDVAAIQFDEHWWNEQMRRYLVDWDCFPLSRLITLSRGDAVHPRIQVPGRRNRWDLHVDGSGSEEFIVGQVYRCNAARWGPCSITIVEVSRRTQADEQSRAKITFSGAQGSSIGPECTDVEQSAEMIIDHFNIDGSARDEEELPVVLQNSPGQMYTEVCTPLSTGQSLHPAQ